MTRLRLSLLKTVIKIGKMQFSTKCNQLTYKIVLLKVTFAYFNFFFTRNEI